MTRTAFPTATLLLTTAAAALFAAPAAAGVAACKTRVNNTTAKLTECVTVAGVREHQAALQAIADANNGIRASGTPGYDASVEYVAEQMREAGYEVTVQPFSFTLFTEMSPPILEQISPLARTYVDQVDIDTMDQSGAGDVTAEVVPVDLSLGDPAASSSGCEAGDFAGFPAGSIALIQRGACTFQLKAENAAAAGAVGVIIFNQGIEGRTGLFFGTLGADYNGGSGGIPVIGTTYDIGVELASGATVRLAVDATRDVVSTYNVLAETPGGDPDNVVMVGAHLDSVVNGPGINDNGSGSAALIEVAQEMAKVKPRNKVRFAWWGAEESGLVGSEHYVANLSEEEIEDIALYLNFDMVGSPNYVFKVYDGDDSDGEGAGPGPDGSAQIEQFFNSYYESIGEPYKGTDFSGRSDYGPFIDVGIPSGGLFTGAEEIKTPEEAAIWGGTAGEQLDPCYHLACDTFDNVSLKALDINADAIAAATLQYAMNTQGINGQKGKGNFKPLDMPMLGAFMAK